MDYKLGVGLIYNTAFLFGADVSGWDIGLYGLNLYGVKGKWRFFDSKVTPYGALAFGLSRFSTPQISMIDSYGNETMNYSINNNASRTAGNLQINIGCCHYFY